MNPHALLKDEKQIASVESVKRLDRDGYLYYMENSFDYIQSADALMQFFDAGCSTFCRRNLKGEMILYRNYDYGHRPLNDRRKENTGVNVVIHSHVPSAKYETIGASDAFFLDFKKGRWVNGSLDDGKTDISPLALLPNAMMDGMNEAGLGVSIMALSVKVDWKETDYEQALIQQKKDQEENKPVFVLSRTGEAPSPYEKWALIGSVCVNTADHKAWIASMEQYEQKMPERKTLFHPILMRLMLDQCSTVNEAVTLAGQFNVKAAVPGSDYHLLLCDPSGKSVVLEWKDNDMIVLNADCATNYRLSENDPFVQADRRYECIKEGLERFPDTMPEEYGLDLLKFVCQNPHNSADRGKTQYSCIYNLAQRTMKIYPFGDYTQCFEFQIHNHTGITG